MLGPEDAGTDPLPVRGGCDDVATIEGLVEEQECDPPVFGPKAWRLDRLAPHSSLRPEDATRSLLSLVSRTPVP